MAIIAPDIGIDLGTSNTLVYVKHKGVVLNEPTLMVVTGGQKKSVKAFGEDARLMLGRTTGEYQSVRPLEDGVIKDYDMTATSVVPPPISTTMLPRGSNTGSPEPSAAANGTAITAASTVSGSVRRSGAIKRAAWRVALSRRI